MVRARSLSTTALACAAFAWMAASGCSKPRNTNTPSTNASVAAPGDTAANTTGSYGGVMPGTTSTIKGNALRSDTGPTQQLTQTPTHRRSRTARHVRRQAPTDTAASTSGVTPLSTDTTAAGSQRRDTTAANLSGKTDTTVTGGQYAVNTPSSSSSSSGITPLGTSSSAAPASGSAACTATSSPSCTASASVSGSDTSRIAQARSDTSWLYGGSSAAHRDTSATRADSINHVNPTDTSRLGVGSTSSTCNCVTPNQPTQSNQPNYPNANCSPTQQSTCSTASVQGRDTASMTTGTMGGQVGVDTGRARSTMGADTGRAGGSANLSDGQIADMVVIANTADSTNGALAMRRSTNQTVKDFARQMMQDHGANNRQVKDLAQRVNVAPVSSDDSRDLSSDATDAMRNLQGKSGADFDRAYIDGEVDMHERVLRALDEKLIPSADNAELKTLLQQTRGVVNQHLQRAREIQSSLRQH